MKVLIAEDDEANLQMLIRLMEKSWQIPSIELRIVGVRTLAEALEEAEDANVTILDLGLLDSDAANTILHIPRFRPPVIVLTGSDSAEITASCMLRGATHVFVKGESFGLISAIFEAMQQDIIRRAEVRLDHAAA